jgi:hypothetical protein
MLRAGSLSIRAGVAEKLSSSLSKLITLERQTFSLDRPIPGKDPVAEIIEIIDDTRWSAQKAWYRPASIQLACLPFAQTGGHLRASMAHRSRNARSIWSVSGLTR